MAWKRGPLPPETYYWGGVVLEGTPAMAFEFADFRGDHAMLLGDDCRMSRRVEPGEVLWYDNSLELPPYEPERHCGPRGEVRQ